MADRQAPKATPPDALDLEPAAARAKAGDQAAFRQLVDATFERLFRVAAHIVVDRDDADDVVQETFVRAWSRIDGLRDPAKAYGWLLGIVRNAARDKLRQRKRRGQHHEALRGAAASRQDEIESSARPDQQLVSQELSAAVRDAVLALPEKHRVVLLLREVDGMTNEQIATLLMIPLGTVESRLHRARAKLTKRFVHMQRKGDAR